MADQVLQLMTDFFRPMIDSLNLQPSSYSFLFPVFDDEKISEMVADGVFPKLSDILAPALTYCIALGFCRFFLHYLLFKVVLFIQPLDMHHRIFILVYVYYILFILPNSH